MVSTRTKSSKDAPAHQSTAPLPLVGTRRQLLAGSAALMTIGMADARSAIAQSAIKMTVGFPPGGSGDFIARLFSDRLKDELDQPIIISNVAGAGGLIAAEGFRHAPADGSNLMIHTISSAITAPLSRKPPAFDPVTDFVWISVVTTAPMAIAVNPKIPATDLKSLIAYIRANPGKLSYGSAGVASSTHLAAELFKDAAGGLDIVHVPYRGSAAAMLDVVNGALTFYVDPLSTIMPQYAAGSLKIFAVMDKTRSKISPEIPTTYEFGVDASAATANILAAPPGTPMSVIDPIVRAANKALQRPDFLKQVADYGIDAANDSSPDKARAFIAAEVARWTPIIRKLDLSL